jgi:hypothetical protein
MSVTRSAAVAPTVWLVAAVAAFVASLGVIGADALWLLPFGERIAHGHLPSSVPYAAASTGGWHNVPAGAELVFWSAYHSFGGLTGIVHLQAAGAAVGIGALGYGVARQTAPEPALVVSLLVIAGALPAFGVTNVSLFSLALFPVLLALVELESRAASRRIWLAVPLLALWGNLHGAALVGWALLACYLVLDRARRRPLEAIGVLTTGLVALCLNPALWHTPGYYWSVFHNEAARQSAGLWKPLTTHGLDRWLIAVFAIFAVLILVRRRIRLWEVVAIAGLAAATVDVSRNGVWLLYVAAYPAARALTLPTFKPRLVAVAAAAVTAGGAFGLATIHPSPGSPALARQAASTHKTVLAEPVLGQQVALAGGRVWVDNPIDAFRKVDQRLYVDWFSGKPAGAPAVDHAAFVLVKAGSAAGALAAKDSRLVLLTERDGAALYRVRRAGRG